MIRAEVGEPFTRSTDNPALPVLTFTKVTVSIDVLTPCATECMQHLVAAATEFGERVHQVRTRPDQMGGPGWEALDKTPQPRMD